MICGKCKNVGKFVRFTSFQYYYCETCKEEIQLEDAPHTRDRKVRVIVDDVASQLGSGVPIDEDLMKEFEKWIGVL